MATIKGQNLRIFVGGKTIAAALECSLSVQMNVQQQSTKDDDGDFASQIVMSLQWSVSVTNAVTTEANRNDAATLEGYIGQTVNVELAMAGGNLNSEKGDILLAGKAILSDVQITAENRRRGTCTIQLTGKKDLLNQVVALQSHNNFLLYGHDNKLLMANNA